MAYGDKPFGLSDLKITNLAGTTQVDLPAAQMLTFKERIVSGELRGDDILQAVVAISEAAEWELEAGGISLEAWAVMTGHTQAETGTTPNAVNTYTITAGAYYPYFKVYGKMVGDDSVSDVHVLLKKCKLTTPIEGEFKDKEFWITKCGGVAITDGTDIAEIIQNETADDLPTS